MRAKEMRERGNEDLTKMLDDVKNDLFRSRLNNATHQLDDTNSIRRNRREIARIKTIMNERALAGKTVEPKNVESDGKENEE